MTSPPRVDANVRMTQQIFLPVNAFKCILFGEIWMPNAIIRRVSLRTASNERKAFFSEEPISQFNLAYVSKKKKNEGSHDVVYDYLLIF